MQPIQPGIYERLVEEGEYDEIQALATQGRAWLSQPSEAQRRQLLVESFANVIPDLLDAVSGGSKEAAESAKRELHMIAELLRRARELSPGLGPASIPASDLQILHAIHEPNLRPPIPRTGLRQPWLFTSAKNEPTLYSELRAELETAEQLDLVISFITWGGYRKLADVLTRATATDAAGRSRLRIRILTTTYMGATQRVAVDALGKLPGVEVRISLDGRRERLHAKAWILGRKNGFGTAFVGSANLSKSALIDGIEWTIKISQAREPVLFESARANFQALWNDPEFQPYDPADEEHRLALDAALREQGGRTPQGPALISTWFDLQPKPFQQAMLDRLEYERTHGRRRNLLVSATGTGKTVVAAFDYRRLCLQIGGKPRMLFVAHQRQILLQARAVFQQVLRDPEFGEMLDGTTQPANHEHLFAMIQTLSRRNLVGKLGAQYWHIVIIDEAHHLPAATFEAFVRVVAPTYLLGLTATPERADGKPLGEYFDARPDGSATYSLRLWDALDQQLLCPFEYYATADHVDLRSVEWGKAAEMGQLSNIIGANVQRAHSVLQALEMYLQEPGIEEMHALAFCVSVEHAKFMASFLTSKGLSASVLIGEDSAERRETEISRLTKGEIKILCTVNLFNEGVDIPCVNTLLLLRPTQSPVVFQQQIGRGLRLHPGKSCCVILDFIGQYGAEYRFDILYQTLTGQSRRQVQQSAESGFSHLPAGCHLQLDKVSRERVIENLKQALKINRMRLVRELIAWSVNQPREIRLRNFLYEQGIELHELYANNRSWQQLKRDAMLDVPEFGPTDEELLRCMASLIHVNDPFLLRSWLQWLGGGTASQNVILMLAHQLLHEGLVSSSGFRTTLDANPATKSELIELLAYLEETSDLPDRQVEAAPTAWPVRLHARYSRRQIQAAIGHATEHARPAHREGVLPQAETKNEILFVTLDKSAGFGETVQYADYAISNSLFHWKTQNRAKPTNASGRRYLESPCNGWRFFLFVREDRDHEFLCAGQVVMEHHEYDGKGPIGITWRLVQPLSAELFRRFSLLRDA